MPKINQRHPWLSPPPEGFFICEARRKVSHDQHQQTPTLHQQAKTETETHGQTGRKMIFSLFLAIAGIILAIKAKRQWRIFSCFVAIEILSSVILGVMPIPGVWFPLAHSMQALVFMAVFTQIRNAYAPIYVQSLGLVVAIDLLAFCEYWVGVNIFYPASPILLAPVAIYQLWLSWLGGKDGGTLVSYFNLAGRIGHSGNCNSAGNGSK